MPRSSLLLRIVTATYAPLVRALRLDDIKPLMKEDPLVSPSSGQQGQHGNNNVLIDIMLACGRLVLSLLGCDSVARAQESAWVSPASVKIYRWAWNDEAARFQRARYENQRQQQQRDLCGQ